MKCSKCYADNPDGYKFCLYCGYPLNAATTTGFMAAPADLNAPVNSYNSAPAVPNNASDPYSAETVGYNSSYGAIPAYPSATPAYEAPAAPVYEAPVYEAPVYDTPVYSTPATPSYGAAPVSGYSHPAHGSSINRKSPLPAVLVAIVAALSTIVLFFNLYNAFATSYNSIGSLMSMLGDLPHNVGREAVAVLRGIGDVLIVFTIIGCLFDLGTIVSMWLIFGGSVGPTTRPIFPVGLMILKILRIISAIGAIAIASIVVIFCVIGSIPLFAEVPIKFIWLPILILLLGFGYLVMTIFFHRSIFRTINAIRQGATTGNYGKASIFLIVCLFGLAFLSLLSFISQIALYVYLPTLLITNFIALLLPLLEGISLCIYNSKR